MWLAHRKAAAAAAASCTGCAVLLLLQLVPRLRSTTAATCGSQLARVRHSTWPMSFVSTGAIASHRRLARPLLAPGSSLVARDWDATDLSSLADASVDRIVSDLPFGHKCRWDPGVQLPLFLDEAARVLKTGGRALLLMQGFRRVDELAGRRDCGLVLTARRRVGVGGFLCWALTLEKA